jgi:hypothetical protein
MSHNILIGSEEIDIFVRKSPEWIALIDVEELRPNIDRNKPVEYHFFLSKFSCVNMDKYKNCAPIIHKVEYGCDYFMTYYVGKLTIESVIRKYIIVSKERASIILAKALLQEGFVVEHFDDVDKFESFINGL